MQLNLQDYITEALSKELPGEKAHLKMTPPGRTLNPPPSQQANIKHSGVLFLLYPKNKRWHTCLIKRPKNMKHHPGQVGFPGGKVEADDLSIQEAAMREAYEEIGIMPHSYQVAGQLSDLYVSVSNFIIHPFVAFTLNRPVFRLNAEEIEDQFDFPIQDFMEKEQIEETEMPTALGRMKVPYYPYKREIIWGATAMILSEFLTITSHYQLTQE